MYKLVSKEVVFNADKNIFIPFDPANTDYAQFKSAILNGTAMLQDADGVEMSPAAAQEFVQGLP